MSSDKNIFPIINIVFLNLSRGVAILDLQFTKIPIIIYEQTNQIFSFREKKKLCTMDFSGSDVGSMTDK